MADRFAELLDQRRKSNDENVLIVDNPEIAALYIQEFERVWAQGTDPAPADIKKIQEWVTYGPPPVRARRKWIAGEDYDWG